MLQSNLAGLIRRDQRANFAAYAALRRWTAVLLLAAFPGAIPASAAGFQAPGATTPTIPAQSTTASAKPAPDAPPVRNADRRRAAKVYLKASKLFARELFEEAMRGYEQAAKLDPANADYPLAANVARSHAVLALIQASAKDQTRGDAAAERAALAHALELDPKNFQANQHLNELGDDALRGLSRPLYEAGAETVGAGVELAPERGVHSFHLHTGQRQIIQQVFNAYGIQTTVDQSVPTPLDRLDVDNVSFETTARLLELMTKTFFVPLDAHRVLVAFDSPENRQKYQRMEMETVYLPGLSATELTDVSSLAKNVFDIQQATADPAAGTITLRAPSNLLNAFNATMRTLLGGRGQVLLDVRMIQLARTNARNTGAELPQSMQVFNVAAEAESIFNSNQTEIQQIISSGLVSATDYWAILAILVAAGDVANSPLASGFATFGGSLTNCTTSGVFTCKGAFSTFGLTPGSATINLNLNSSETRQLDHVQLRLGDGEAGTVRSGTRYPIQTSSYSSITGNSSSLATLLAAGTSSSLTSALAAYESSASNIPQVEYQDLGLTLKATPKVMRNDDIALTLDLKIDALTGSSLSGNPILDNRLYSGVVTLKQGETVAVVSNLSKTESRSISGTPGLSEVPGLNNLTGKDTEKNYAKLLIIMTPHVIRGIQPAGRSPMLRIERGERAR
jgi:tetratricopeptide (TPR) repeat protein